MFPTEMLAVSRWSRRKRTDAVRLPCLFLHTFPTERASGCDLHHEGGQVAGGDVAAA